VVVRSWDGLFGLPATRRRRRPSSGHDTRTDSVNPAAVDRADPRSPMMKRSYGVAVITNAFARLATFTPGAVSVTE